MILDVEIRGVIGPFIGSRYKYQMRKLVCKQIEDIIHGGHYYSEGIWTEWEDIPIVKE